MSAWNIVNLKACSPSRGRDWRGTRRRTLRKKPACGTLTARFRSRRWGRRSPSVCRTARSSRLSNWHALTLLHLLDLADGTPPTGRTIALSQYKDGLVRGSGLDRNAELIVRRDLGVLPPEELTQRCKALGAELLPSNADFCARFDFAPRYPVWLKIWFADEEFPASGRLLLDESALHYLTIEDAVTAASLILDRLTQANHWTV